MVEGLTELDAVVRRSVGGERGARREKRSTERQALDVVPVEVGHQGVGVDRVTRRDSSCPKYRTPVPRSNRIGSRPGSLRTTDAVFPP